jgi:hypothetical protein
VPNEPKVSAVIQGLLDKGLLDRLPLTFSAFFFEQFQQWHLLFPAEQDYQERLFILLDRSEPAVVDSLFAPVRQVELKMGVSARTWPRHRFSSEQVDFLNRNPYYGEWRRSIADVFARLDRILDTEKVRRGQPALVVVIAPTELSVPADRMWLRLQTHGQRIPLELPEGEDYLSLMLTDGAGTSLLDLYAKQPYNAWSISAGQLPVQETSGVTLSYDRLKKYRLRLMDEVQRIIASGQARTPRQLSERLARLNIQASESEFASDEILSEFVRTIFLSGNGTLLINNTFAEWATIQAVRRARPLLTIVSFGVRNKLKPFSSLLMYADQEDIKEIPSQMDIVGTHIDLEVFYQYIWQEFEKHPEYRNNTAYLFIADGLEEMFCIAPPDFPLLVAKGPLKLPQVFASAKQWLNL